MGSGFRCGSVRLTKTLPQIFLIHSIYSSAVARSPLDSGSHLQSKNYLRHAALKISKRVTGILAADDLRWVL